jgi:hypothetical protein
MSNNCCGRAPITEEITRVTSTDITALQSTVTGLRNFAAGQRVVTEQLHLTSRGDKLLTVQSIDESGVGHVALRGDLDTVPQDFALDIQYDESTRIAAVTIRYLEPVTFQHTWEFALTGSTFALSPRTSVRSLAGLPALAGLNWWCVLRCGGISILGILVRCAPAILQGPAQFIECVVQAAGEAAAGIAVCVATECFGRG